MDRTRERATQHAPTEGQKHGNAKAGQPEGAPVSWERARVERNLQRLQGQKKLDLSFADGKITAVGPRDKKSDSLPVPSAAPVPLAPANPAPPPAQAAAAPKPHWSEVARNSKEAVADTMTTAATYNAVRGVTNAAKLAEDQEALTGIDLSFGDVPDAAGATGALIGGVGYGASTYINIRKSIDARKTAKDNKNVAVDEAAEAWKFLDSNGKEGSGAAYLKFRKASEPVLVRRNGSTAAELDRQVFGANIPRYFSNMISALASFANGVGKATGVVLTGVSYVAGGAGLVGGIFEFGACAAQLEKGQVDLAAAKRKGRRMDRWKEQTTMSALSNGLYGAQRKEIARREKLARRTVNNAKVGFAKASVSIATACATIAVGALVVGAAAVTGGIAIGVIGGLIGAAFIVKSISHALHEAKVARHAERRQLQAQVLAQTYTMGQLEAMMASTDAETRKCWVCTVQKARPLSLGWLLRKEKVCMRRVDVGDNGYAALQIQAHRLATKLGSVEWNDQTRANLEVVLRNPLKEEEINKLRVDKAGPETLLKMRREEAGAINSLGRETVDMLRQLRWVGRDATEIMALCQVAIAEKVADKRSAFLRKTMGPLLGSPLKAEAPLAPIAHLGVLRELTHQQGVGAAELDYVKLEKDFKARIGAESLKDFQEAIRALPPKKRELPEYAIARRILRHREQTSSATTSGSEDTSSRVDSTETSSDSTGMDVKVSSQSASPRKPATPRGKPDPATSKPANGGTKTASLPSISTPSSPLSMSNTSTTSPRKSSTPLSLSPRRSNSPLASLFTQSSSESEEEPAFVNVASSSSSNSSQEADKLPELQAPPETKKSGKSTNRLSRMSLDSELSLPDSASTR